MSKNLCIHGHFYQPPRFDPWLEDVLPEGSAAPEHDWNARIARECYTPLAFARRLDASGMIAELINCYAWMSFNFGPTLLRWMERHAPGTYARIQEADRLGLARLGHGNALAQVYHHAIMPLATELDKNLEIGWAIQDFEARFNRAPEGMWLAETAVDIPTLTALAEAGIAFTILAPRQARAVRGGDGGAFQPVTEDNLDTTRPYLVRLPQGKSISVFFYDSPVSRAVAFERLLENGEQFWTRLGHGFGGGLRHIATDGESYGHHFKFGEMALAYVIDQARQGRDGIQPTNHAAYLAAHPATDEALIHENSSWSCVHGLGRWMTHCGCADGGHPDWIQDWRRPLRRCLNYLKYYVDEHYFKTGPTLVQNAGQALAEYGRVLAGTDALEDFLGRHGRPGLGTEDRRMACRLLVMQRCALASFSSCAWFFDDIARIEPLNGLTNARRAMDLLLATGGPDVEAGFERILHEAQSNMREDWDGVSLWRTQVSPRRPVLSALARFVPAGGERRWPGLTLTVRDGMIHGRWSQTLDEDAVPLDETSRPGPADGEDPRHLADHAFQVSRAQEDALLEASCRAATAVVPLLTNFTEGQHVPQASLALHMPGLIWNWLTARLDPPADLVRFAQGWIGTNPDIRAILERRAEDLGAELAGSLPQTEKALLDLITRARGLGLGVHWWAAQNILMALPTRGRHEELGQLLGLAPVAP
ncbi:MAG: DUF3536 domain-containing protein [Deltaproteobacteria bacterium]|nr:DUF3536 domain-containing protein [Deltaproteobacteria bacterium]